MLPRIRKGKLYEINHFTNRFTNINPPTIDGFKQIRDVNICRTVIFIFAYAFFNTVVTRLKNNPSLTVLSLAISSASYSIPHLQTTMHQSSIELTKPIRVIDIQITSPHA